jgi:hypothetical protein
VMTFRTGTAQARIDRIALYPRATAAGARTRR